MLRAILAILVCIPVVVLADNPLTKEAQNRKYLGVLGADRTRIIHRGDYLIVEKFPEKQDFLEWYFFTKPGHPADPGIVHVRLIIENGESRVESIGTHGPDEAAFQEFHKFVNERMLQLIREVGRKPPNKQRQ